jgi:hypothetical protein
MSMKGHATRSVGAALWGIVAITSPAWAADERPGATDILGTLRSTWTATIASDFRYFSWSSNRGFPHRSAPSDQRGRGSQIYVPFAVQLVGRPHDDLKIEILGRGGWVWSRQRTTGLSGEVSTMTDTVASTTFTYYGISGIQPFASVSFNFPTGRSNLSGAAANARMDPDFVEITSFGEAFNIGPTGGFNLPITSNLMATFSAGYTWRGAFRRESSIAATDPLIQARTNVDPGDALTVTGALGFQLDQLSGQISASYSLEGTTTENGAPLYRAGNRYVISGKFSYNWSELGQTNVSASFSHSDKNKVLLAGASTLVTEPFNTNSNVYRVGLEHLFPLEPLWVGPIGSYLYRDRNSYDSNTFQFVPAKQRWTAGLVTRLAAGENITFNARFEHVWTNERENPADAGQKFSILANTQVLAVRLPPIVGTGWQAAIGLNFRF